MLTSQQRHFCRLITFLSVTLRLLVVSGWLAFPTSLAGQQVASSQRPPSNTDMANLLEAIAAAPESTYENPHANNARLEVLLRLPDSSDPREQWVYWGSVAGEMLRAGRIEAAIVEFERLRKLLEAEGPGVPDDLPEGFLEVMERSLGIAYLQRAQRINCLSPNAAARCAIPPAPGSAHPEPESSRKAIEVYTRILEDDPRDLSVRWIINLAYMWIGEHPDGVPPEWLIPRSAFGSTTGFSAFTNVAPSLGLDSVGLAGGSVMEDFDADGDLDLMASSWGLRDQLRYIRNNGDGTFDDVTVESGLEGIVSGLNLVSTDYDNDGFVDVFVLRGGWLNQPHPNSLLRNNGDGSFTDVTDAAGLSRAGPTQTAAWGDYDNDGDVDLFVGNESQTGSVYPSQLFRNNGNGTFTDTASVAGIAVVGFVKGVTWGDYDNDDRLDLYVSRFEQTNLLFHNEGPAEDGQWTFRDVTATAGVAEPRNSFPTWFFDYDNDGWLDLFVAGFRVSLGDVTAEYLGQSRTTGQPRLFHNQQDGTFLDVTEQTGLNSIMATMGSNFGDLDNDGFLDCYLGTGEESLEMLVPNRVFRNVAGTRFEDVTTAGGFGHVQKGHGVSFGDIDHDGDQDVYMVLGGAFEGDIAQNLLLLNPGHGNAWVTLRLRGSVSNRMAIGARIQVEVDTPNGARSIYATVGSGGTFGASTLQQEIGLGDATGIRQLTVIWPATGQRIEYRDVPLNQVLVVREESAIVEPVELSVIDLGS